MRRPRELIFDLKITKTYFTNKRAIWHAWLSKNHKKEKEIWLVSYKKNTGKKSLSYDEAIEEALCFGWIDSAVKTIDSEKFAQRFSPRNPKSLLSPLNKDRVLRLIKARKMTKDGLEKIKDLLKKKPLSENKTILQKIKNDKVVWKNFKIFSLGYQNLALDWVTETQKKPLENRKRFNHLIQMTAKGKKIRLLN